jgi:hypothetical protein
MRVAAIVASILMLCLLMRAEAVAQYQTSA